VFVVLDRPYDLLAKGLIRIFMVFLTDSCQILICICGRLANSSDGRAVSLWLQGQSTRASLVPDWFARLSIIVHLGLGLSHARGVHHSSTIDPELILLLVKVIFLVSKFNVVISVWLMDTRLILCVVIRVLSVILGHVHFFSLEVKSPLFLGLLHPRRLVEGGEGNSLLLSTEYELGDVVVLQTVTPLSPTAQLVLFIFREHHVDHLVIELQVLLLEPNDAQ
jgi:hypothetical protein